MTIPSLASVAYRQSGATSAANAAAAGITARTASTATGTSGPASSTPGSAAAAGSTGATSGSGNALGKLSSNFSDFLSLLLTQLKNQDPTSPLSANQFTSELVQFSGVEQQINTNSSLSQLINLTNAGDLTQASSMLGSKVTATSDQIPLQNGSGSINFTAPSAEPVAIAIYNSAGQQIRDASFTATHGQNSWSWNGTDNSGNRVPDGAYKIAVVGADSSGTTSALPFTVTGTATGVTSTGSSVSLELGGLSVPFTSVTNVAKGG